VQLFAFLDPVRGQSVAVLDPDGRVVPIPDWDGGLDAAFAEDRYAELLARAGETAAAARTGQRLDAGRLVPLPAVEFPGKVVCIGLNYADHIREQHLETPPRPTLFAKFGNAIVADGEPVVRPEGTDALDLEVELGVVIGRRARRVAEAEAMEHVAGYLVVNDVTARDWQGNKAALQPGQRGDGQWLRAKGSDTFLPIGPVFASRDAIADPHALRLRSWRRPGRGPQAGEWLAMQDGTTADMVWRIPELIAFVSSAITLEPGDILSTGTPAGVGVFRDPPIFLEPGDRVRCEVERLGSVENPIVDWTAVRED
jgi:2,4-didehydro-3-deoxy-L-rhamnonate hydrolase